MADLVEEPRRTGDCGGKKAAGSRRLYPNPQAAGLRLLNSALPSLLPVQLHVAPLDEACIAHIMRGVLQALAYLHGEKRIHRDVKVGTQLHAVMHTRTPTLLAHASALHPLTNVSLPPSGRQRPAVTRRGGQDVRLWRGGSADRHHGLPPPYLCRDTVLDGTWWVTL